MMMTGEDKIATNPELTWQAMGQNNDDNEFNQMKFDLQHQMH